MDLGFIFHLIKSSRKSLVDFILLLRGKALDILGKIKVSGHVHSLELVVAWRCHNYLSHPLLEILKHDGHCLSFLASFVHFNKGFAHLVRSTVFNHNFRSKFVSLEIFQSRRDNHRDLAGVDYRAESHQSNSCLEWEQVGLIVRTTLWEHCNCATSTKNSLNIFEYICLVNFWQNFVLIRNLCLKSFCTWILKNNLGITENFLNYLIFNPELLPFCQKLDGVTGIKLLCEKCINT